MFRNRRIPQLTAMLIFSATLSVAAQGVQQPDSPPAPQAEKRSVEQAEAKSTWLVTIVHQINIAQVQKALAERGFKMTGELENVKPINITTGIVIDREGHVLTRLVNINPDAGESAIGSINVVLASGESRPARYVGYDGPTGYSLLSVEGLNVEPALLAMQAVIAPGLSVTILSPKFKTFGVASLPKPQQYPTVVERPGQIKTLRNFAVFGVFYEGLSENSFNMGVVLDGKNQIIGLPKNVQDNLLYFYTSAEARRAADRIVSRQGNVPRAWLGVGGSNLNSMDPEELKTYALPANKGVMIKNVAPNTPAAQSGLQVGDVIFNINDQPVESIDQISAFIGMQTPGQTVEFDVWRDSQSKKINVKLGERGFATPYAADRVEEQAQQYFIQQDLNSLQKIISGINRLYNRLKAEGAESETLQELQSKLRFFTERKDRLMLKTKIKTQKLFLNRDADRSWIGMTVVDLKGDSSDDSPSQHPRGVRVSSVSSNSIAARAGLKSDDVIVRVSGYVLTNREGLLNVLSLVQNSKLDSCEVLVKRGDETISLKFVFSPQVREERKSIQR